MKQNRILVTPLLRQGEIALSITVDGIFIKEVVIASSDRIEDQKYLTDCFEDRRSLTALNSLIFGK